MAPLPAYVNRANAEETKDVAMDLLQARDVETRKPLPPTGSPKK
jgi:hypothetical protein